MSIGTKFAIALALIFTLAGMSSKGALEKVDCKTGTVNRNVGGVNVCLPLGTVVKR